MNTINVSIDALLHDESEERKEMKGTNLIAKRMKKSDHLQARRKPAETGDLWMILMRAMVAKGVSQGRMILAKVRKANKTTQVRNINAKHKNYSASMSFTKEKRLNVGSGNIVASKLPIENMGRKKE